MKKPFLAVILAVMPVVAAATPITIGFGGTVDNDPYGTGLADFSGQFTYDSAWADLDPGAGTGNYQGVGAAYGIQVSFAGGGSWSLYGQNFMLAILNDYFGIGDEYIAYGSDGGALSMELDLFDSTAALFGSDALPTDVPLLSGFDWPRFALFDSDAEFGGQITSLSCLNGCMTGGGGNPGDPGNPGGPGNGGGNPNTVPEPGSLALMGLGLAALMRGRARRAA